ncbi:hypothetical protein L7F22_030631 [Adiantum nelumboides]|nr:hypothetical protein [Adiantum nelumboides]
MIGPQQALLFQALHQRWRAAQDRHGLCKQALNRNLFLRLLAFISDLVAYRDSKDAQHRMEFPLPTATALFDSPLYFPHQPHDGKILNQFVSPNGLTVLQTLAAQFKRAPRLEGVCTAHTLAPLLKRLFAIGDDAFHSKEFKDFQKEFTRIANAKLRPLCNTSHIQSQLHGHHNQEAVTNKKQQQQKENRKKKCERSIHRCSHIAGMPQDYNVIKVEFFMGGCVCTFSGWSVFSYQGASIVLCYPEGRYLI